MNATALVLATAVSLLPSPLAATPQAEAPPPTAASRSEAGAGAASGFIHGAVTTRGGTTYRGLLRWGTEEAFWGDLFNSAKEENAYADEVPRRERPRQTVEVFGVRVGVRRDGDVGRQFVARFGDIAEIEADGTGDAVVRLKNGSLVEVSGGANDVEAEVVVWDEAIGKVELPWRKIATITFSPAPAGARPYAARLYGVAKTDAGTFEGFVQWDSQECVSTDVLDGDAEDGRLEIAMGNVRSIVRRGRSSSSVTLNDGRELTLSGTNDVDSSIRGIFVEDPRYGRVKVSWSAFDRLDLREAAGSGPGYEQYAVLGPLRGAVTVDDGRSLHGRLVFDIDEAEQWEILQGSARDVEYLIPFAQVAAIVPRGSRGSLVTLRTGEELRLEDSKDVGEDNAGVLVYSSDGERPTYVPWETVRRIDFER